MLQCWSESNPSMPQAFVTPTLCSLTINVALVPWHKLQRLHKRSQVNPCKCNCHTNNAHLLLVACIKIIRGSCIYMHGLHIINQRRVAETTRWQFWCLHGVEDRPLPRVLFATLMCSRTNTGSQVHIAHHSLLHCKVNSTTVLCAVVYRWDCWEWQISKRILRVQYPDWWDHSQS